MSLVSEDIEILRYMYNQGKVEIYFFHEKYMLSVAQINRVIKKFENKGVIIRKGNYIEVTELGRLWIFINRKKLFLGFRKKYWKDIPLEMIVNS